MFSRNEFTGRDDHALNNIVRSAHHCVPTKFMFFQRGQRRAQFFNVCVGRFVIADHVVSFAVVFKANATAIVVDSRVNNESSW